MKDLRTLLNEEFKYHSMNEMARMDDPKSPWLSNYEIWVYGNDITAMSPHFHILNKQEHFNIEIRITDLEIIKSTPRKGIPKSKLTSWDDLGFLRKALIKWLTESDKLTGINNYVLLISAWNTNNREGKQVNINDCISLK